MKWEVRSGRCEEEGLERNRLLESGGNVLIVNNINFPIASSPFGHSTLTSVSFVTAHLSMELNWAL